MFTTGAEPKDKICGTTSCSRLALKSNVEEFDTMSGPNRQSEGPQKPKKTQLVSAFPAPPHCSFVAANTNGRNCEALLSLCVDARRRSLTADASELKACGRPHRQTSCSWLLLDCRSWHQAAVSSPWRAFVAALVHWRSDHSKTTFLRLTGEADLVCFRSLTFLLSFEHNCFKRIKLSFSYTYLMIFLFFDAGRVLKNPDFYTFSHEVAANNLPNMTHPGMLTQQLSALSFTWEKSTYFCNLVVFLYCSRWILSVGSLHVLHVHVMVFSRHASFLPPSKNMILYCPSCVHVVVCLCMVLWWTVELLRGAPPSPNSGWNRNPTTPYGWTDEQTDGGWTDR